MNVFNNLSCNPRGLLPSVRSDEEFSGVCWISTKVLLKHLSNLQLLFKPRHFEMRNEWEISWEFCRIYSIASNVTHGDFSPEKTGQALQFEVTMDYERHFEMRNDWEVPRSFAEYQLARICKVYPPNEARITNAR